MKFLVLLAALVSYTAHAELRKAPFPPYIDKRFHELEQGRVKSVSFVYDYSVYGGDSTADIDLGVDLPANAVVTKLFLYVNDRFTDSGTGSLQLYCESAEDLMAYRDMTVYANDAALFAGITYTAANSGGAGAIIGTGVSSVTTYNSIASSCSVKARVRGDSGYVPLTGGKLTGVIEYFKLDTL